MSAAECALAAARAAIGARFRVHGRDPAFGLDCVGLAALAAGAAGFAGEIPDGYALRGSDAATLIARFDASGLMRCGRVPGAIALCETGPAQFHLVVLAPDGFVHADAMLRRVVERPGPPPWPLLGCWQTREA